MPTRPSDRNLPARTQRIGMLGTYPPRRCGLATFAVALESELRRAGHRVAIVRIRDDEARPDVFMRPVAADLVNGDPSSIRAAAAVLSSCDAAIVQHEYGIFGGPDGDEVLDLLDEITVPTVVVLHTVGRVPTTHQREVLEGIADRADRLVVMTENARARLISGFRVDPDQVLVIPHGASVPPSIYEPIAHRRHRALELLTWGLLGPGKGIEHVIDALAIVGDVGPRPHYTVAGVTHPRVLAHQGEVYRESLLARSERLGLGTQVTFDETYRDVGHLTRFVAAASMVVLPYDSRDQATSGVLVDAIAAGTPVIATDFPHARELLATGAGIVVPHDDPVALASAIRAVTLDPDLLTSMTLTARSLAPTLAWSTVAATYASVVDELAVEHASAGVLR
jgi:glycosyltransferase involved in cell wall biosynthesis